MRVVGVLALAAVLFGSATAAAAEASAWRFVTLGTNSGPIPNAQRAEPANLLRAGDKAILIDVGDAAPWQLAKAGVPLPQVEAVFVSHLHFDHTGGLFAFMGQRYQGGAATPVTIYGPRGTGATVEGLLAAMAPMTDIDVNKRAREQLAPREMFKVVELEDGARVALGDVTAIVAANSHHILSETVNPKAKGASLSFRFDVPGRSIVYTGDTGPSGAVEALAAGADVLVAEVMDPDLALAAARVRAPNLPAMALGLVEQHFRRQHLSPTEVGRMANRSRVKKLVLTHNALPDGALSAAKKAIAAEFKGRIVFAKDLDAF
jgi:ribonuclease BN (tRNA processing enzyme)